MSIHVIQGIRVNSDGSDCAALYDFTTGLVLATPIFEDADEAERFLEYCHAHGEPHGDPGRLTPSELQIAVARFRSGKEPGK